MFITITITLAVICIIALFVHFHLKYQFWAKRGIWTIPYLPVIGNTYEFVFKPHRWEFFDQIYKEHKHKRIIGAYNNSKPTLLITDPELVKLVMVKDADSFVDRSFFEMEDEDKIFKEFLSLIPGEKWKALRTLQSPIFSSEKIKSNFPLIEQKVPGLIELCNERMEKDGFVEMTKTLSLYTLNVICSCAFGLDFDCYKNEDSEIVKAAYDIFDIGYADAFKFALLMINKRLFYSLGFTVQRPGTIILEKVILETIKIRQETGIKRGDFLDLLLDCLKEYEENKSHSKVNYPMSMNTVVSSCILFLAAGYDTTANALSFAMYLLANNPECQDKLRDEIKLIIEDDGEINYQNVMEAKYLDACFSETLRMYGAAHSLERKCTKDYKFPDYDFIIPAGTSVNIPSWSLHYDSDFWEEPRSFKPERFLPENKHKINQYAYLPFGHGPRNCIGMRFALMESKTVLAQLVLNFEISLKPGFKLTLGKAAVQTIRAIGDGIPVILEPHGKCDHDLSNTDSE